MLMAGMSFAGITTNLLQNGGFETGSGSAPDIWIKAWNAYRLEAHPRSGAWGARLTGNNLGTTNYTLFIQPHPTEPGAIWRGEGWAAHFEENPLAPDVRAALQLSFWDTNSNYVFGTMSPAQIHAGSPTGEWIHMTVEAKAPPMAAYACLNPLLRQCEDGDGAAWFDDCSFGPADTSLVHFAGQSWRVAQQSFDFQNFEKVIVLSTNCVWVDTNGWLHLAIRNINDKWWCGQVESTGWYGYGEYRWYTRGRVDLFDTNANLGLFTYAPPDGSYFQEIDIELTYAISYGTNGNLHYTIQPWQIASNGVGFQMDLTNELTTHKFNWLPGRVDFVSYYGHSPEPLSTNDIFGQWTYISSGVPAPWEQVMMNLWLVQGYDPQDTQHLEAVICDFKHTPFSGWIVHDDFSASYSNGGWTHTGAAGSDVIQTNGQVGMSPNGIWQTSGLMTTGIVHWTTRGPVYAYRALLSTISVTQASTGNDMQGLLSLCSEPNNGWLSTNAASLYAAYDQAGDSLEFLYYTKTGWPNHEGILRYRCLLTNAVSYFSNGGIRMGFSLENEQYRCELLDVNWNTLPVDDLAGTNRGPHALGNLFCNAHFLLGAQNVESGAGRVFWDDVSAGVDASNRLAELSITQDDALLTLNWDDSYNAVYQVSTTTNLQEPFLPYATNFHATHPHTNLGITSPPGTVHFFRLEPTY